MHKIIGIDFGLSRIGVAYGQTITNTANPVTTIKATDGDPDWEALDHVMDQWRPTRLVVGLPVDCYELESEISKQARAFAKLLEQRYSRPVDLINEAFSTREARWRLTEYKQKSHQYEKVDAYAACVIIESWFDVN